MIQTDTIGSLTEIYVGGGNFLTESYPTNFHTFVKRKILTKTDSIENYRFLTEAEKTALEKSDAAWVEPPQCFIDSVTAKGAVYNPVTGFFELNGLVDLSYKDMLEIDKCGVMHARYNVCFYENTNIRTNHIPHGDVSVQSYEHTFRYCRSLEVAHVRMMANGDRAFLGCKNLRLIKSFHGIRENGITNDLFPGCDKLERIEGFEFKYLNKDCTVNLQSVPNIDLWTLSNLAASKKEEWAAYLVTITVHPDVFAKLTDSSNTEWSALMTLAAEKNISFVSA